MNDIRLEAYLFFTGNCREAMEFYKQVFGGELTMQTYDEMPSGEKVENSAGKIMHASLKGGDAEFMAGDSTRTEPFGQSSISLSLGGTNEEKLRGIFEKLAEGGEIQQPLEKVFWGDLFGAVKDKFGTEWMVNIESKKTETEQ